MYYLYSLQCRHVHIHAVNLSLYFINIGVNIRFITIVHINTCAVWPESISNPFAKEAIYKLTSPDCDNCYD